MSDKEDKKFLPKVTLPYSPTIFGVKMPLLALSIEPLPQPISALVDSGATNSMLHPVIAKKLKLKIDYEKTYQGTGAGGVFKYVKAKSVEVGILGQKYSIAFDAPLDNDFAWTGILGHDTIFKFSKMVFKSYKQEFDVFIRLIN